MAKKLMYNVEARNKVFTGIEKVANAVKTTLGPCGRLVLIEKEHGLTATKDGVTVAKSITLEDPEENLGASLVKEVASKTNDAAGDSTTTSTVLAYAIVKEGLKAIASGAQPIDVKNGIDKAASEVVEELKNISREVKDTSDIVNVATISANNDPEIGKILAEAVEKVGKDGVITVEESKNMTTSVKIAEGLQFDNGWISPYFSTNKERQEVEFDESYILLTDKKISSMKELLPILEAVAKINKPITIVCDDMDGEALGTLIINSIRGSLKVAAVKAPSFGDNRKAMLLDIAALTGATYISDDFGNSIEKATIDMLGKAKVKISKTTTTLLNGGGSKEVVDKRISEIKAQIDIAPSKYEADKLKSRLAKLTGGVAVVSVGAATETELKERKFRVEDTIAATRAALEQGIIIGGGAALAKIGAKKMAELDKPEIGYRILYSALKEPAWQIAENAGTSGDVVVDGILSRDKNIGYNARTGEYVDMFEAGILDTRKAISMALLNAASIAGMVLTTECIITDIKEKEQAQLVAQPMPMGY